MTAIIFGANGQDGYYLTNLLQQQGYEVIGVSRANKNPHTDIVIYDQVATLIKNTKP
ncbi:MAG: NAD-dependent epimerase/dehydratase family protein, partial [Aquabacterium sp.]|nr:NAD-dependent epimerase/dehydratase family protein [Ferruginibacter sp.]